MRLDQHLLHGAVVLLIGLSLLGSTWCPSLTLLSLVFGINGFFIGVHTTGEKDFYLLECTAKQERSRNPSPPVSKLLSH